MYILVQCESLCVTLEYYSSNIYNYCIYQYQVFKSDDPLDSKDFNPVDYINAIFPTEQVCFDFS